MKTTLRVVVIQISIIKLVGAMQRGVSDEMQSNDRENSIALLVMQKLTSCSYASSVGQFVVDFSILI